MDECDNIHIDKRMASVAKWLRHWVVVPAFAGSSPVVRPYITLFQDKHLNIGLNLQLLARF